MKIYDCFAFFNELDILELRLRELYDVVDHFVLVEATRTFQKKPKPLVFQENKARFAKFQDKITHIVVDEYPSFWTHFRPVKTWDYDSHQKEQILQGLKGAAPDDLVIVSDLDEIPLKEKILEFKNKPGIRVFEQFQSYYFLNYVCTRIHDYDGKAVAQRNRDGFGRWRGSVMLEYKLIENIEKTRCLRDQEGPQIQVIENGGWHFSYMGGIEKIIYKIKSWAHTEYNNPEYNSPQVVLQNILDGKDLFKENMKYELFDLNNSKLRFPSEIRNHPERYQALLRTKEQLQSEIAGMLAKAQPAENLGYILRWTGTKEIKSFVSQWVDQNRQQISGKVVVDIPAGNGHSTELLMAVGAQVKSFDLFPEFFKVKDRKCEFADLGERIPCEDNSVDLILCQEGIEHVSDPIKAFSEFNRVLKTGGLVVITTPNYSNLRSRMSYLLTESEFFGKIAAPNEIDSIWFTNPKASERPKLYFGHVFLIGIQRLKLFARISGFSMKEIYPTRVNNTSALIFPFYYLFVLWFNFSAYRRMLRKSGPGAKTVARSVFLQGIDPQILLDNHLFVIFTKSSDVENCQKALQKDRASDNFIT